MDDLTVNNLLAQLSEQLTLSQQLLACLNEENKILIQGSPEAIEAVAIQKAKLAEDVEQQQQNIASTLNIIGATAVKTFIENYEGEAKSTLKEKAQALETTAYECFKQNAINSKIIYCNQESHQHLLALLFGRESTPLLYNSEGKSQSFQGSQGHSQV